MSEQTSDEKCTEKIIDLTELNQNNEPTQNKNEIKPTSTNKNNYKFVDNKPITKLTEEEQNTIIYNYINGIVQPNYTCKPFKNGTFRIIKSKQKPSSLSQQITTGDSSNNTIKNQQELNKYKTYTNEQLLFEHIIELNNKYENLARKHKKLKHKYNDMQNDLYIDDCSETQTKNTPINNTPPQKNNDEDEPELNNDDTPTTDNLQDDTQTQLQNITPPQSNIPRNIKTNWRTSIKYL